jgi:hypothetical protein
MHSSYPDPDIRSNHVHVKIIFTPSLPQLRVITIEFWEVQFRQLTHISTIRNMRLGHKSRWIRMRCRARVGREIGRGWSGMDRTRDWVMGLDEYLFKSTIPVVGVDAVPIRAINAAISGGEHDHRPDRKVTCRRKPLSAPAR